MNNNVSNHTSMENIRSKLIPITILYNYVTQRQEEIMTNDETLLDFEDMLRCVLFSCVSEAASSLGQLLKIHGWNGFRFMGKLLLMEDFLRDLGSLSIVESRIADTNHGISNLNSNPYESKQYIQQLFSFIPKCLLLHLSEQQHIDENNVSISSRFNNCVSLLVEVIGLPILNKNLCEGGGNGMQ